MVPGRIDYPQDVALEHPGAIDYLPQYLHDSFPDPTGQPDPKIRDDFFGTRRKLRIGILGAGICCINFLHYAEEQLKDVEIVVYAPAAENLEYIKTVTAENGFYRYMRFQHEILQASWMDDEAMWTLSVKDLKSGASFEDKVDLFLELNGPVRKFKGEIVHPAYWNDEISVDGKRVALIGYGCSGVQIGPNIVDKVSKLYTWFRSKTYILPPPNQSFSAPGGANFKYSDEQKSLLADPDVYLAYRKAVDDGFYRRYPYVINGSRMSQLVKDNTVKYMKEKLASKPEILDSILPEDFDIGCRRQTFAYGYMEALTNPKTTVFTSEPQGFTAHCLMDADGKEHEIDLVIAATGYDQSHMPRFPKIVNGRSMNEEWADLRSPPSYMAVMLKSMPNYFNPSSAFGPLPQGNFYQSCEAFTKYIVKAIDKMQVDRILSIKPKDKAVDHFVRHSLAYLKRTAVMALWPGARNQFIRIIENPRFEDLDIFYEDPEDMFAYFGNGWTLQDDADPDADKTWYMGRPNKQIDTEIIDRLKGTDPSVREVVQGVQTMGPEPQ
ncbi:hypothetical protein LTR37_003484 [Vermiconidia calcicola]|uniref:Uncharacterized protein n=1 Tax=Vermiconidia calcicola TaxID=1690605 RepID=A0ACC3NPI4_9PEZI|nr:hypothetical protein LTR37_003484 [Vermiconidia calcicola]